MNDRMTTRLFAVGLGVVFIGMLTLNAIARWYSRCILGSDFRQPAQSATAEKSLWLMNEGKLGSRSAGWGRTRR